MNSLRIRSSPAQKSLKVSPTHTHTRLLGPAQFIMIPADGQDPRETEWRRESDPVVLMLSRLVPRHVVGSTVRQGKHADEWESITWPTNTAVFVCPSTSGEKKNKRKREERSSVDGGTGRSWQPRSYLNIDRPFGDDVTLCRSSQGEHFWIFMNWGQEMDQISGRDIMHDERNRPESRDVHIKRKGSCDHWFLKWYFPPFLMLDTYKVLHFGTLGEWRGKDGPDLPHDFCFQP